jgi:hypothetical protein
VFPVGVQFPTATFMPISVLWDSMTGPMKVNGRFGGTRCSDPPKHTQIFTGLHIPALQSRAYRPDAPSCRPAVTSLPVRIRPLQSAEGTLHPSVSGHTTGTGPIRSTNCCLNHVPLCCVISNAFYRLHLMLWQVSITSRRRTNWKMGACLMAEQTIAKRISGAEEQRTLQTQCGCY